MTSYGVSKQHRFSVEYNFHNTCFDFITATIYDRYLNIPGDNQETVGGGIKFSAEAWRRNQSNGNIFPVTGPLCAEFAGHRWISLTNASDAEIWCFFDLHLNKREAGDLRRHRAHYDVTIMYISGTTRIYIYIYIYWRKILNVAHDFKYNPINEFIHSGAGNYVKIICLLIFITLNSQCFPYRKG